LGLNFNEKIEVRSTRLEIRSKKKWKEVRRKSKDNRKETKEKHLCTCLPAGRFVAKKNN